MEELAKDARLGLLVGHALTPSTVIGILMMLREAFKCRHEAGALDSRHCQRCVRWGYGERGERLTRRRVPWFGVGFWGCSGLFMMASDDGANGYNGMAIHCFNVTGFEEIE